MARLEIDIALQNLQNSLSGLKSVNDELKKIGTKVNINISTNLLKNSQADLNQAKANLTEVNAKIKEQQGVLRELESQAKQAFTQQRIETEKAKTALAEFNLEQKKSNQGRNKGAYSNLSRELNEMRNEAKNLGAQMILLDKASMSNSVTFNTLKNRFDVAQKEALELDQAIKKLDGSLGQNQRNVGNYGNKLSGYQQAQSGANGVAMEFNRIIQDAPFGIMGIGNNIQQLVANWGHYTEQTRNAARETGKTVTTMTLLGGAIKSILSPTNLLLLGVSALTSALTAYQMKSSQVKEVAQEMNNTYVTQLGHLQNVVALTEKSAKTERDKATAVSMYNKELGDTLGKITSYAELEKKLIDSGSSYVQYLSLKAQAEATFQLSLKKTEEMMKNIMFLSENKRSEGAIGWLNRKTNDLTNFIQGRNVTGKKDLTPQEILNIAQLPTENEFQSAVRGLDSEIKRTLNKLRDNWKQGKELSSLGADLTGQFNALADAIGGIKHPDLYLDKNGNIRKTNKGLGETVDYLQKIKELTMDKEQDFSLLGKKGQAKELQELINKYADFYNELDKLEKKYKADESTKKQSGVLEGIAGARKMGDALKQAEENQILAKYLKERNDLIDDMYQKAGWIAQDSRNEDLEKFEKYIKDMKAKLIDEMGAKEGEISEALKQIELMGTYHINIKWNDKDLAEWGTWNDKLQKVIDKPFKSRSNEGLSRELQIRISELKKAYEQLLRATGGKFDEKEWQRLKAEVEFAYTEESRKIFRNFLVDTTKQAYSQIFTSLKSNVEEFGFSLNAIFFSVGETISSAIGNINTKALDDIFENIKENGLDFLSSTDKAVLGLTTAGNFLSSVVSKTSVLGQGLGGGLSGAASGITLAKSLGSKGLIGGLIGGAIGLISGIFGAKKAKKQEELQRKQLEEQKKANALLERMNALAYTSSIIGGMTTSGLISGMNRDAFGRMVARIDGRDIVLVMDKVQRLNGR